ncbi:hypothetical protein VPH35_101814 [Triticum aestivum]
MAEGADAKEKEGGNGTGDEGNERANKKQQKKKEDGDGGKKKEAAPVVLGVDLHCDGCARKVVKAVKAAQGVEGVAADVAAGTVTVCGKAVDPWDLKERVEARTHKPVAFVSPPNPPNPKKKKDGGDTAEGKKGQAGDGKGAKTAGDDKKKNNKEGPETTVVVKIGLHCNGCIDRIRRTAHKIKGVKEVKVDTAKEHATVQGTMDAKALPDVLRRKLRRDVDVVPPPTAKNKDGGDKKKQQKDSGDKKKQQKDSGEDAGEQQQQQQGQGGGGKKKNRNKNKQEDGGEEAGGAAVAAEQAFPMAMMYGGVGGGGGGVHMYKFLLVGDTIHFYRAFNNNGIVQTAAGACCQQPASVVLSKTMLLPIEKDDGVTHNGRKRFGTDAQRPPFDEEGVATDACHWHKPSQHKLWLRMTTRISGPHSTRCQGSSTPCSCGGPVSSTSGWAKLVVKRTAYIFPWNEVGRQLREANQLETLHCGSSEVANAILLQGCAIKIMSETTPFAPTFIEAATIFHIRHHLASGVAAPACLRRVSRGGKSRTSPVKGWRRRTAVSWSRALQQEEAVNGVEGAVVRE